MATIRPRAPITAVVTGASSGIGEAVAHALARRPGARLVLVARRAERLRALAAELPAETSFVAADLTEPDAPERVRDHVAEHCDGRLTLLVNNAGAGFRGTFAAAGYANVQQTMAVNFDAVVRLTEALLPLLRASAPSAIVNVSSTAGRVGRAGAGAYSASKFALAGWSDSLRAEELPNGVHVGAVYPGFISTEGFPQRQLTDRAATRWIVSTPRRGAAAVLDVGLHGKAERYVPRAYGLVPILRHAAPWLVRRVTEGAGADGLTPSTTSDVPPRESEPT